jgi:hypothetical protein
MKPVPIKPSINVAETLRQIADSIDSGESDGECCTMVLDSKDVFSFGVGRVDDSRAAVEAVFDMTLGIHRLMHPVVHALEEGE